MSNRGGLYEYDGQQFYGDGTPLYSNQMTTTNTPPSASPGQAAQGVVSEADRGLAYNIIKLGSLGLVDSDAAAQSIANHVATALTAEQALRVKVEAELAGATNHATYWLKRCETAETGLARAREEVARLKEEAKGHQTEIEATNMNAEGWRAYAEKAEAEVADAQAGRESFRNTLQEIINLRIVWSDHSPEDILAEIEDMAGKSLNLNPIRPSNGSTTLKAQLTQSLATGERLREALKEIARYDRGSKFGEGICPYGCDTPHIAQAALAASPHAAPTNTE